MIVRKFGTDEFKEIPDPPANYIGCIYCYAASKTCHFFKEGDVHFIDVDGELRAIRCMEIRPGDGIDIDCKPVTEDEARELIREYAAYN